MFLWIEEGVIGIIIIVSLNLRGNTWNNNNNFVNYNKKMNRRGFEGVFMGVCSSVDVTQSEGDLPDFNQSEH